MCFSFSSGDCGSARELSLEKKKVRPAAGERTIVEKDLKGQVFQNVQSLFQVK